MNIDMYRDEKLNKDDPTAIENKFSIFESEIAKLISDKILDKDEITLTRTELEKFRIFTTLLSFRSNSRMEQYINNHFDDSTKKILLEYQPDGNFEELWKRELNFLTTCRTYNEIQESNIIDPIIKQDFHSDLTGYYITFVDARGGQFLLSDIYPTAEIFPMYDTNIYMHYMFPLSPTRMMILNHIMFKNKNETDPFLCQMINLSQIKEDAIIPPKTSYKQYSISKPLDKFYYKVRKIYADDVEYINALFLNETNVGIIFRDKDRIINSIISFNRRNNTKQSFKELEDKLKY